MAQYTKPREFLPLMMSNNVRMVGRAKEEVIAEITKMFLYVLK